MNNVYIIFSGEYEDRRAVAVCSTLDKAKELAKTLKVEDLENQIETFEVDKTFQKFYFYECSIIDDKYRKTLEVMYSELEGNDIVDTNNSSCSCLDWTKNFPYKLQAYEFYGRGTTKKESLKNAEDIRKKFYLEKDCKIKEEKTIMKTTKFMKKLDEPRKVEKLINKEWIQCKLEELKKGDTFRMFEPDGEPVKDNKNKTKFIAESNSFRNEYDGYTIKIKDK